MNGNSEVSINEIYQLIGRNIIVFQSIEIFLIDIHIKKSGKGTEKDFEHKKKKVKKMSFGDLIDERQIQKLALNDGNVEIMDYVYSFDFLPDIQFLKDIQNKLKKYSSSRNQLVHKFQHKYNLSTAQGRLDAKKHLNIEYENLVPLKEDLRKIVNVLIERHHDYTNTINSDEFTEALEKALK
jgi:pyruvate dehydrogenase complex dehydrogenase (E1) component